MDEEVACLDLGAGGAGALLGVGLWTDISVRVLRLPALQPLHTEQLGGGTLSYRDMCSPTQRVLS